MPELSKEEVKGRMRDIVTLQPGEKVVLCRCFKSAIFPLCDSAHRHLEETQFAPVVVRVPVPEPPADPAEAASA